MNNEALIAVLRSDLDLEFTEKDSYAEIHRQLAKYLDQLINSDFEKLLSYLYRIDVSETKLRSLLEEHPQENAGNIIATLIIERQLEKIKTREQFSTRDNDIDENEKW